MYMEIVAIIISLVLLVTVAIPLFYLHRFLRYSQQPYQAFPCCPGTRSYLWLKP